MYIIAVNEIRGHEFEKEQEAGYVEGFEGKKGGKGIIISQEQVILEGINRVKSWKLKQCCIISQTRHLMPV